MLPVFFHKKWPEGFRCPKCEHHHAFVIKSRKQPLYECASCKHQTTLPLELFLNEFEKICGFGAMPFIWFSHDKRGASASQLARELGLSYQTA